MNLANKIINLRKKHGLSQEALSEKMDVSKLTITKWESGTSRPNLDQIVLMSKSFDVSIDYLVKEDLGAKNNRKNEEVEIKEVSLDEATLYLDNKSKTYKMISRGVLLCIFSFLPLVMLLTLSGQNYINMSTDVASAVGLVILFGFISIAIAMFLKVNYSSFDFEKNDGKVIELESGVRSSFNEALESYKPVYLKRITFSIILIIMSVVPLIIVSLLTTSDSLVLWMVLVMMLMIGLGVYIIIPTSMHFNTLKFIVDIGGPVPQKSKELKRTEKVAAFYWPLVIAVYLGWSLWTMAWGVTWILWPVAALSFAALIGLLGLFDSKNQ